jgi:hypothetical protein
MTWLEVNAVARADADPRQIAAFAIDKPAPGDTLPGAGMEIDGWAVGAEHALSGIRVSGARGASRLFPLDVDRPDVAADYPAFPHAAASGFTFWAPVDQAAEQWRVTVEALLEDGSAVPLAEIAGTIRREAPDTLAGVQQVSGPDFVIIGTQRGGTTSLHAYLAAHPLVRLPAKKELHFLTDRHERGRDWYLGQFPRDLPAGTITGEATPYALFHPLAPARLRAAAPEAKLVVLLRNPVDRAYSHYLLERSRGQEPLGFAEALDAEPARLAGEEAKLLADPTYVSQAHNHASYLARGDYAAQLERWFAHVPRDRFLILRSEDLYREPATTFAHVTDFLGLPRAESATFVAHNRSDGLPLDPALRDRLAAHFAPANARLRNLLGWDPGWR